MCVRIRFIKTVRYTARFHLIKSESGSANGPEFLSDIVDQEPGGVCSWIGLYPIESLAKIKAVRLAKQRELLGPVPEGDMLDEEDYETWAEPDRMVANSYAPMPGVWVPPYQDYSDDESDADGRQQLREALRAISRFPLQQRETIVSFKSR